MSIPRGRCTLPTKYFTTSLPALQAGLLQDLVSSTSDTYKTAMSGEFAAGFDKLAEEFDPIHANKSATGRATVRSVRAASLKHRCPYTFQSSLA
eukprot:1588078-Pleurochrysis_carterae.AAC.1